MEIIKTRREAYWAFVFKSFEIWSKRYITRIGYQSYSGISMAIHLKDRSKLTIPTPDKLEKKKVS